mmetsp:Transcript_14971/g.31048  ORF Transcript_14971/g.31048 Transcript_14971/m.31048 type:complete len:109 (+) Transcript_14971:504-830(+)
MYGIDDHRRAGDVSGGKTGTPTICFGINFDSLRFLVGSPPLDDSSVAAGTGFLGDPITDFIAFVFSSYRVPFPIFACPHLWAPVCKCIDAASISCRRRRAMQNYHHRQ